MGGMPDPNASQQPKFGSMPYDAALAAPVAWGVGMLKNTQKVADAAKGMVSSAVSGATLPGDVYTGKVDPNSSEGFNRVQDLAGTMAGGGTAFNDAPKGAVGMFVKPYDRERFRGAMELVSSGAGQKEIWGKTQTHNFPGGVWAQELSDHDAMFKPEGLPPRPSLVDHMAQVIQDHPTLSRDDVITAGNALHKMHVPETAQMRDVLHHPTLFQHHPEAARVPVLRDVDPGSLGGFSPTMQQIEIAAPDGTHNPLSTTLHELQHYFQDQNGWPQGGDALMFMLPKWRDKMKPGELPSEAYRRLAGEEMARATEKRLYLSPQERARLSPAAHMDAAPSDQIIRRGW